MDLRNNQSWWGNFWIIPPPGAVFQKRFGKYLSHPMVATARTLTLQQLIGFAQVYLPKPIIHETLKDLRNL